jgi:hypothetical protein
MRSFNYAAIGVLMICMIAGTKVLSADAGSLVIAVADDVAQIVAPETTQLPLTEDGEDLLNTLD